MPLDIGVGILLALGLHEIGGVPLTPLFVLVGIGAALFPDIDLITALFGKWRHREVTHYPLLYIPCIAIGYFLFPAPYVTLVALGILAHLIHDTVGIGWGVTWLGPFSSRRFLFFPEKKRRESMGISASWIPEEKPEYEHAGSHWTWIRDFYFRPNPLAYIEYGTLLVALLILASYIW